MAEQLKHVRCLASAQPAGRCRRGSKTSMQHCSPVPIFSLPLQQFDNSSAQHSPNPAQPPHPPPPLTHVRLLQHLLNRVAAPHSHRPLALAGQQLAVVAAGGRSWWCEQSAAWK